MKSPSTVPISSVCPVRGSYQNSVVPLGAPYGCAGSNGCRFSCWACQRCALVGVDTGRGWTTASVAGMVAGVGNTVARAMGEANGAVVASRTPEVASGSAPVGRGDDSTDGLGRGVVLITSGCPQLVNTNTNSRILRQRTAFTRTSVLKLYNARQRLSTKPIDRPRDSQLIVLVMMR
jgi:hypothetical protein